VTSVAAVAPLDGASPDSAEPEGDDWKGKFDHLSDICEVVYFPRTPSVSTTALIEHIAATAG